MGKFLVVIFIPFMVNAEIGGYVSDDFGNSRFLDHSSVEFASLSYTSFYFLKEIQDYKFNYVKPLKWGNVAGVYEFFGGKLYNENILSAIFIYDNGFSSIGMDVGMDILRILNDNVSYKYKIGLFGSSYVGESTKCDIYVSDIQNIFSEGNYSVGARIVYDNNPLFLSCKIGYVCDEDMSFYLRSGVYVGKKNMLYIGYNTLYRIFSFGFVLRKDKIMFRDEVKFQSDLGMRESAMLSYMINGNISYKIESDTIYDLNEVTFKQLLRRGIASDICCGIIDYRGALGQYFDISDLKKVKGIGDKWIKEHLDEFDVKFEKMDINRVNIERLLTTPGIERRLLKKILKYRETHMIWDLKELKNIKGVDSNTVNILKKYYKSGVKNERE